MSKTNPPKYEFENYISNPNNFKNVKKLLSDYKKIKPFSVHFSLSPEEALIIQYIKYKQTFVYGEFEALLNKYITKPVIFYAICKKASEKGAVDPFLSHLSSAAEQCKKQSDVGDKAYVDFGMCKLLESPFITKDIFKNIFYNFTDQNYDFLFCDVVIGFGCEELKECMEKDTYRILTNNQKNILLKCLSATHDNEFVESILDCKFLNPNYESIVKNTVVANENISSKLREIAFSECDDVFSIDAEYTNNMKNSVYETLITSITDVMPNSDSIEDINKKAASDCNSIALLNLMLEKDKLSIATENDLFQRLFAFNFSSNRFEINKNFQKVVSSQVTNNIKSLARNLLYYGHSLNTLNNLQCFPIYNIDDFAFANAILRNPDLILTDREKFNDYIEKQFLPNLYYVFDYINHNKDFHSQNNVLVAKKESLYTLNILIQRYTLPEKVYDFILTLLTNTSNFSFLGKKEQLKYYCQDDICSVIRGISSSPKTPDRVLEKYHKVLKKICKKEFDELLKNGNIREKGVVDIEGKPVQLFSGEGRAFLLAQREILPLVTKELKKYCDINFNSFIQDTKDINLKTNGLFLNVQNVFYYPPSFQIDVFNEILSSEKNFSDNKIYSIDVNKTNDFAYITVPTTFPTFYQDITKNYPNTDIYKAVFNKILTKYDLSPFARSVLTEVNEAFLACKTLNKATIYSSDKKESLMSYNDYVNNYVDSNHGTNFLYKPNAYPFGKFIAYQEMDTEFPKFVNANLLKNKLDERIMNKVFNIKVDIKQPEETK